MLKNISSGKTEFKTGHPTMESCLLVSWSCLVPLLTKCQTAGCSSIVAEENMETQRDGINIVFYNE